MERESPGGALFRIIGKSFGIPYDIKKPSGRDRTAAEWKMAAGAAPPQAENPASGILFYYIGKFRKEYKMCG